MINLKDHLPPIKGTYTFHGDLKNQLWFKVGGPIEVLFKPLDQEDLQFFLKNLPAKIPYFILGAGSNILVRDGGISGVAIKLGKNFNRIAIQNMQITAGAAVLDRTLALECVQAGIGGLEFFIGIPGTIGGAVKMNAGAFGGETKNCLLNCDIIDREGNIHTLTPNDLNFGYRTSSLSQNSVVISATFQGYESMPSLVEEKIKNNLALREESQPTGSRTGGSTFKNPLTGPKAWELIDQAGCRGLKIGGAQMSEKHCNFLINTGNATAQDIEDLGTEVQRRVLQKTKVLLEWEIDRVGQMNPGILI